MIARVDEHREAVARLLAPRSVAIYGATPRTDSLGGRPIQNLVAQGYQGRIFPVNPRYARIGDRECYPSLAALPEIPDVVLVLVAADRVFEALDQAADSGVTTAIVFGGGFAEAGSDGAARQTQLGGYRARGLRLCGPNVNGIFNVNAGIAMGFSPAFEMPARSGGIALLSQSGAIATSLSSRGMETGMGFSHVVATGNEVDLEISDFLEFLIDDPDVSVIGCFIEALRNPTRFLAVAREALKAGKPIVALKAGRSATGQAVSMSHTGAIAGSYSVIVGAMRQAGVIVADRMDDLLGIASVFAKRSRPSGGTAVMSLSGGMASLTADGCVDAGVPLATFAPATNAALLNALPAIATVSNPLDVTGQVATDPGLWLTCATAIASDVGVDSIVSIVSVLAGRADRRLVEEIASVAPEVLQVCVWASAAPASSGLGQLLDAGVPVFSTIEGALRALSAWRRYWTTRDGRLAAGVEPHDAFVAAGREDDPWDLLRQAGVPIARHEVVATRTDLAKALQTLRFPLALKIQSADIPHKTELGLLRLGIMTAEDAEGALDTLMAEARRQRPDAAIEGVLVQEMIAGRREMILGVRREPMLGPAVVFGFGGIFSEVIRDVSVRLTPVSAFDVDEMVEELRTGALLGDVRDLRAMDRPLLANVVGRFSTLVQSLGDAHGEFEINPLILADDGRSCAAVDVLVGPTARVAS